MTRKTHDVLTFPGNFPDAFLWVKYHVIRYVFSLKKVSFVVIFKMPSNEKRVVYRLHNLPEIMGRHGLCPMDRGAGGGEKALPQCFKGGTELEEEGNVAFQRPAFLISDCLSNLFS